VSGPTWSSERPGLPAVIGARCPSCNRPAPFRASEGLGGFTCRQRSCRGQVVVVAVAGRSASVALPGDLWRDVFYPEEGGLRVDALWRSGAIQAALAALSQLEA
jgi:hypothetical protein